MYILKALLLWSLVSVHLVGAAFFFRRLFPRESVWFAFIVPEILFVLACNFIEYHFALTQLQLLLPFTATASVAVILWPKSPWRVLRLPTLLFLAAFAFTFLLRLLRPDITDSRDGISDLSLIANYMYGQTLPVESTWLPPIKMVTYYCFEHYAASVLTRLLGIDIGTGFNISAALLSTYIYFLTGAIAWHLSRGKLWIVILMLVLTACAATGDAGYLWLTTNNLIPENIINPYSIVDGKPGHDSLYLQALSPIYLYDQHLLMPPGFGGWMGCLHSVQTGQLLMCFSILALIELVRRKRTNWPWISLVIAPFLILTTCTWGLPMIAFISMAGLIVCLRRKIAPANLTAVLATSAGLIALQEPMLVYFLEAGSTTPFKWATGLHTEVLEFLAQWWPIYLPLLLLLFVWRSLHPAIRIVLILAPLTFACVETWNLGDRCDTTGKFWGLIFVATWVTFIPEIARYKTWPFRLVLALIVINSALSLGFWTTYFHRVVRAGDIAHLDGRGQLRTVRSKARILEVLSRLDQQIIISGRSSWAWDESGLLPLFSHNRAYVAWSNFTDTILYTNGITEAVRREVAVNKVYDGQDLHPLYFLRQADIAALVIYPDDDVDPNVVEHLKQDLAPYYTYEDGNYRKRAQLEDGSSPVRPCAGVFLYHPQITLLLGVPKDPGGR